MSPVDIDLLADFVPRLPEPSECSLAFQLKLRAEAAPEAPFVAFEDGTIWSNAEACSRVHAMATKLAALGVGRGDAVLNWLPNGRDHLEVMLACFHLGAVEVPINTAYRGALLERIIAASGAKIMLAHPELLDRLCGIELAALDMVVSAGPATFPDLASIQWLELDKLPETAGLLAPVLNQPWDLAAIIFSSGTTGPSKGVLTTYAQLWSVGQCLYSFVVPTDRMFISMPLFHIGALGGLFAALTRGGTIAVCEPVRPRDYWEVFSRTDATVVAGIPTGMVDLLLKEPESPQDKHRGMRVLGLSIVDETARRFAERFDTGLIARFSMSETSCVTSTPLNPSKNGVIGRARPGIEVRVVDDHDVEVDPGQVGEMVLRSSLPWVLSPGYMADPSATAEAWRNGWFHTGDLVRQDEDGDYVFIDRKKDAIRRRGENISAWEVENEIRRIPDVENVAVIPVKSGQDEEVLAVIQPRTGIELPPEAVLAILIERLPHFMVPRFIRIVDLLPRTETGKIQKSQLREEGLTSGSWDREVAGIQVRRAKLSEIRTGA